MGKLDGHRAYPLSNYLSLYPSISIPLWVLLMVLMCMRLMAQEQHLMHLIIDLT